VERTVERYAGTGPKLVIAKERAIRFSLKGLRVNSKVSWFFKGARSAEAEISWEIGARGRPRPADGKLRYPIGYLAVAGAATGHGLHISAPFVSDQARHAPAAGDPTNACICDCANAIVARIIARHLVPTIGPSSLELIRLPAGRNAKAVALLEAGTAGWHTPSVCTIVPSRSLLRVSQIEIR
jgi:hypothetical protein